MFKTEKEALHFLRRCNNIIIPSMFTYWCHSSRFSLVGADIKKVWKELPTDVVEVKGEMSFLSRQLRFEYAIHHKSLSEAPTFYTNLNYDNLKNFQLKVVMPKMKLTDDEKKFFNKDDNYYKKLAYAYRGLGDGRHPKLPGKTKIYMFGYMQKDEMSGKQIDTIFGVREEDLVNYANAVVKEILQVRNKLGSIPLSKIELPEDSLVLSEYENKREMLNYGYNYGLAKAKENSKKFESEITK